MKSRERKEKIFEEVKRFFSESEGVIMVDFMGMNAGELLELRRLVESEGGIPKVVKNTILEKVFSENKIEGYEKFLKYNTIALFPREDVIRVLKAVIDYANKVEKLKIKGMYFEGRMFDEKEVLELSKLPSRKELLGIIVGDLQGVISGFVGVLNGILTKFVGTIEAIEKKKVE